MSYVLIIIHERQQVVGSLEMFNCLFINEISVLANTVL